MRRPEVSSQEWWDERGVAEEVRSARPYIRWTTEDLAPVRDAYKGLTAGQLRTVLGWARQSDGLVIYRHSFERVAPDDPRRVYPEVRPDKAVVIKTIWHYHGRPMEEPLRHPRSGKPLSAQHVHRVESMKKHIARDRDPDDHRGINTAKVHAHRDLAKYLFPPSTSGFAPWIHSHKYEYEARVLRHVPDAPPGIPREEYERLEADFRTWFDEHSRRHHYNKTTGMYEVQTLVSGQQFTLGTVHLHAVPAKLRGEQLAKRIDVNPLVWQHGGFAQAQVVFFAIEGCIKADAILTALLRAGRPPAVFSVPSVSLWEATYPASEEDEIVVGSELGAFASTHLGEKLVCIVPDADAHTKDEVMTQALLCRSTLRRLGARAEIVLPPDDRLDDGIKGVDDYLGKGGGTLEGMVWYWKEPPRAEELDQWLLRRRGAERWKADRRRRAADTLAALAIHAGDNGEYSASIRLLARASGRRTESPRPSPDEAEAREVNRVRDPDAARKRFERGIKDLLEIEAISANKPLSIRQERWLRKQSGWHLDQGLHWAEDGVVITIHEELRTRTERRGAQHLLMSGRPSR